MELWMSHGPAPKDQLIVLDGKGTQTRYLRFADAKPILGRLQEIVVSEQLERYCKAVRPCPRCHRQRHLKDYRCRRFDTVFGKLGVHAPRFDGCRHCGERLIASPVSELLPERVSPELRHLQAELAAQFLTVRPPRCWRSCCRKLAV
jgi:hypothetical protein